jgi:hypothetical protein
MNLPVGILDENGSMETVTISEKFLVELCGKLRKEGITKVHTSDDNGNVKTYNAQAVIMMAKGCEGSLMYLPLKEQLKSSFH